MSLQTVYLELHAEGEDFIVNDMEIVYWGDIANPSITYTAEDKSVHSVEFPLTIPDGSYITFPNFHVDYTITAVRAEGKDSGKEVILQIPPGTLMTL